MKEKPSLKVWALHLFQLRIYFMCPVSSFQTLDPCQGIGEEGLFYTLMVQLQQISSLTTLWLSIRLQLQSWYCNVHSMELYIVLFFSFLQDTQFCFLVLVHKFVVTLAYIYPGWGVRQGPPSRPLAEPPCLPICPMALALGSWDAVASQVYKCCFSSLFFCFLDQCGLLIVTLLFTSWGNFFFNRFFYSVCSVYVSSVYFASTTNPHTIGMLSNLYRLPVRYTNNWSWL